MKVTVSDLLGERVCFQRCGRFLFHAARQIQAEAQLVDAEVDAEQLVHDKEGAHALPIVAGRIGKETEARTQHVHGFVHAPRLAAVAGKMLVRGARAQPQRQRKRLQRRKKEVTILGRK